MNRILRIAGLAVLAALTFVSATTGLSGTTGLPEATGSSGTTGLQDTGNEYKIGPKDLLEITLLGVPEINKLVVRVSEEGRITLPMLGEVDVGDLTKFEVEKKLAGLAGEKIVINPQVTVHILDYRSRRVSVVGAVEKPGPFELLGRQTVLAAISEAGGLSRDAGEEIIVIRQLPGGESTSIRIPVDGLLVKGEPELNIPLEPGDVINVPVERTGPIYVFGQVKNPGALEVKRSHPPTLTQAIAQAGGFTDRANRKKVRIRRKDAAGKETEIVVSVRDILRGKKKDEPLMINDTVYVPESIL
jgi:polysaccharide export outer membrane protein